MIQLKTQLKTKRDQLGLTQQELAELVGVRRETLTRLEQGKYNPSLKLGMDLACALQTTVEELFRFET